MRCGVSSTGFDAATAALTEPELFRWAELYSQVNFYEVWFCRTFGATPNDPRLLNTTDLDLRCMFYAWFLGEHPEEAARIRMSNVKGNIQMVTGDARIDALEEILAKGGELPDLVSYLVADEDQDQVRAELTQRAIEHLFGERGDAEAPEEEPSAGYSDYKGVQSTPNNVPSSFLLD